MVSNLGRIYKNKIVGISYGSKDSQGYMNFRIGDHRYAAHRVVALVFIDRPTHLQHIHMIN